ncbi:MAG: DNA polymerase III subunit delta [Acidimicrobiaceae bacterium]|nr:DNA polymerase III subunit delta [Acidimicrobiaceae bacterium]
MAVAAGVIPIATMIVGDDPALVYNSLDNFSQKVEAKVGSDLERITLQGGDCSISELVGAMSQTFMFSPCALIVLRDPSQLKAEEVELLLQAIESYSGENYLVLANFSGTVNSKLKGLFSSRHALINCSLKNKSEKKTFLGEAVNESGLRFAPDAYRLLSESLGEDVANVVPLLELLKTSLGEGARVDVQTIESYLSAPGTVAPWDFTDAIESGRVDQALEFLWRLMGAGDKHPLWVLGVLQRRFTELAVVNGSGVHNSSQALAALKERDEKYTRPPFVLDKMLASAKVLGYRGISQAFVWMSQADRQIKGEGGLEPELAIELLVARLAKSFSSRAR